MAGKSINKVILIGNLGKDPEVKYTPQGTPVAKLTLATNERFKDKSGEWQDRTEWHNVVLWQRLAEIAGDRDPGKPDRLMKPCESCPPKTNCMDSGHGWEYALTLSRNAIHQDRIGLKISKRAAADCRGSRQYARGQDRELLSRAQ
jgi:hypothetical protein